VTPYQLAIKPAETVRGAVAVPGDKSISHRYALLGAIAAGTTKIEHLAPGADVASTIRCIGGLGAGIEPAGPNGVQIRGGGRAGLSPAAGALDAGNSGTTMRLLAGLVAGYQFFTTLTGDESLSRRPMRRVIDPLTAMGAQIGSREGCAPLEIHGASLSAIDWTSPVPSAQVKSALMLAGLRAAGTTVVREPLATRDHTERAFPTFGLTSRTEGLACFVDGGQDAVAPRTTLVVPGDPSSAAVWAAAAAALPGSSVRLDGVCLNPHRLGFVAALERMGASIQVRTETERAGESVGSIHVAYGANRHATISAAEVPALIDELPVLAARAALGGGLEVTGAAELRVKESDRITALVAGLRSLGVDARELPDGFIVEGHRRPAGGTADAAGDHRLVMAFAIVALGASHPSIITGAGAVAISYPDFERDLAQLVHRS
jgi:3-phosphoshikimate 1-carboxyvinyltransferase